MVVGTSRSSPASWSRLADEWCGRAAFTLTSEPSDDPRVVTVPSVPDAVAALDARIRSWPVAAAVTDDVLRAGEVRPDPASGLVTESLAYSTLQSGGEFAAWLAAQGPRRRHLQDDPVLCARTGGHLGIRFNRPDRHNAFSDRLRQGLLAGLDVARLDPSVVSVTLSGVGPSFCSGGDLDEFGLFTDAASAHLARSRHCPAAVLDRLRERLGAGLVARVHGAVLGSGLEMAAFCGRVVAAPDAVFGLPELALGLLPGAGGTVSIPRRIGRWRTSYLVLTGERITAPVAADWGLVDEIRPGSACDGRSVEETG